MNASASLFTIVQRLFGTSIAACDETDDNLVQPSQVDQLCKVCVRIVRSCTEYEHAGLSEPLKKIRRNYVYLTHEMDVQTDLLDRLLSDGVLEVEEKIEIDQLRLPTKRCEKLLSVLRCKTLKQYEIFLEALRATNQSHVADVLTLEGSFSCV